MRSQNDVLRSRMTPFNGNLLKDSIVPGRITVSKFTVDTIPQHWEVQNLEIVAIVHKSNSDQRVRQVTVVK